MKYNPTEITNIEELKDKILALKMRSERQKEHLQNTLVELKDSVKPINILKQMFGVAKRVGTNNDLVQSALGVGGSLAARRLFFGKPKGIAGRLWSAGADVLLHRLGLGLSKNSQNNATPFWLQLLTNGRKVLPRIIVPKSKTRFDSSLRSLPGSGTTVLMETV